MTRIKSALVICLSFCLSAVFSLPLFSGDMDNLAPKAPPVLPVEDFTLEHDLIQIGAAYNKQVIDSDSGSVEFKTYGLNANGTSAFSTNPKAGWSFSGGADFLSGTMDFDNLNGDMGGVMIPMGLDFAWRPYGTVEGGNLMLFAGISGSYTLFTFSSESDTTESTGGFNTRTQMTTTVTVSGFSYGFLGGAKAAIAAGNNFKIVPYIFIQRVAFSMSYTSSYTYTVTSDAPYSYPIVGSDSDSDSISAPAVTSLIYGFDILIGNFSVGTMLDLMKTDNKSISFSASYKFPVARGDAKSNEKL